MYKSKSSGKSPLWPGLKHVDEISLKKEVKVRFFCCLQPPDKEWGGKEDEASLFSEVHVPMEHRKYGLNTTENFFVHCKGCQRLKQDVYGSCGISKDDLKT